MTNYNQIRAVASAPPKNQVLVGFFIAIFGGVWALVSFVSDLFSFMTFYGLVMMVLGVSLSLLAKHQQKKLEDLKGRLCGESGLASASADGFLSSYKDLLSTGDITGLYLLYNQTKDMYYVGQGAGAIARAAAQLLGRGNKDVYADYKYGDDFSVRIIPLEASGYSNLKDFKRAAVQAFAATGNMYGR